VGDCPSASARMAKYFLLPYSLCANPVGMNLTPSQRFFGKCFTGFLEISNRVSKEGGSILPFLQKQKDNRPLDLKENLI